MKKSSDTRDKLSLPSSVPGEGFTPLLSGLPDSLGFTGAAYLIRVSGVPSTYFRFGDPYLLRLLATGYLDSRRGLTPPGRRFHHSFSSAWGTYNLLTTDSLPKEVVEKERLIPGDFFSKAYKANAPMNAYKR